MLLVILLTIVKILYVCKHYYFFFLGKKIFIVSKQKNRQKIQKIDIYNIHKLYTKKKNNQHTT